MSEPVIYASTDPAIVALIREQRATQAAWLAKVAAARDSLPWAAGDVKVNGMFGSLSVSGILAKDPQVARSTGWKLAPRSDRLMVPMKGPRGEAARQFLAEIGTCATAVMVIGAYGAPQYVSQGTGDGRELISAVRVHLLGEAVHIEYPVEPTDTNVSRWSGGHRGAPDPTIWTRVPLSVHYTAKEAADALAANGEPS